MALVGLTLLLWAFHKQGIRLNCFDHRRLGRPYLGLLQDRARGEYFVSVPYWRLGKGLSCSAKEGNVNWSVTMDISSYNYCTTL